MNQTSSTSAANLKLTVRKLQGRTVNERARPSWSERAPRNERMKLVKVAISPTPGGFYRLVPTRRRSFNPETKSRRYFFIHYFDKLATKAF